MRERWHSVIGRVAPGLAVVSVPVLFSDRPLKDAVVPVVAFAFAVVFGVLLPGRPGWNRVWPWTLTVFGIVFGAFAGASLIAGVMSNLWGWGGRFELPWGLAWETSGVRGEGVGFTPGRAFLLTPLAAAAVTAAFLTLRRPPKEA
ncbi:hypothetical protein GCM10022221_16950 [Actinocorallia aurea]